MPKLPRVISQQPAGVLQLPRNVPVQTAEDLGAGAFQELTAFGGTLQKIATKLQDTNDDLEITRMRGEYDLQIAELEEAVQKESLDTPLLQADIFRQRAIVIGNTIKRSSGRTAVQNTFQKYINLTLPAGIITAKSNALKIFQSQQIEELNASEARTRKLAAGASNEPAVVEILLQDQADLAARMAERNVIDFDDVEKRDRLLRQNVLKDQMDFLRRTDPTELRRLDRGGAFNDVDIIDRLKILEGARKDEDAAQRRADEAIGEATDLAERDWSAMANLGLLPQIEIDEALAGHHPLISPDKARQYQIINNSPPTGQGTMQIQAIMQEYHLNTSSQLSISKAREALTKIAREMGRPNKALSDAADELQTDERTMRGVRAAEITAGIKRAKDQYISHAPTIFPRGLPKAMGLNKQKKDLAEINTLIRNGMDPDQAWQQVLGKRERREQTINPQTNKVLKLLE